MTFPILRQKTQWGKGSGNSFIDKYIDKYLHQGDLDFKEPELSRILKITKQVLTIICIFLEQAAVISEIAESSGSLLSEFGAYDDGVLNVVFGEFSPSAILPFELPSSMEAVKNHLEDVPYNLKDPLFPLVYGLSYRVANDSIKSQH